MSMRRNDLIIKFKLMKTLIKILVIAVILIGCKQENETNVAFDNSSKAVVSNEIPELSIYNLPSTWTTQDNEDIELKSLQGDILVMVMIYTTCKAACPRLVSDMRNIESQIPKNNKEKVKLLLVSIDPETDTPARLKTFAKENKMDNEQWLFLRGSKEITREFAAVLAVNYKKISPMDFSHSNIISVFDTNGVMVHQQEGLGVDNKETVNTILELANKN